MAIPTKKSAKLHEIGSQPVLSDKHPKKPSKNHQVSYLPQQMKSYLPFVVRHPIDGIWGWLSSVRTAIFLITSIALICLIGIYFVQAPGEVLADPVAYAAW